MIDATTYKLLHLIGLSLLLPALGALALHAANQGDRSHPWYKVMLASHGTGMLLLLIAGFGLLARIGIHWPWPGWVWVKLAVFAVLGGLVGVVRKRPALAKTVWWATVGLSVLAASMALYKPL